MDGNDKIEILLKRRRSRNMDFVKKIRNQQRFDNKEQLKTQIARDCKITNQILAGDL